MTPIERAARALCELDGNPPGATMDGKPLWVDYLPEVRAVIAAIREPSEGMIEAGKIVATDPYAESAWDASNCWEEMIDALLEDEPK